MNRASRYWVKTKSLESAVQRVRDLHRPWSESPNRCVVCDEIYPCRTLKALEALEEV